MSNAVILLFAICMGISGFVGYLLGRRESAILSALEKAKAEKNKPPLEKPAVILGGDYTPPKPISAIDNGIVGVVEPKTPERIQWEADQALTKEARGY